MVFLAPLHIQRSNLTLFITDYLLLTYYLLTLRFKKRLTTNSATVSEVL